MFYEYLRGYHSLGHDETLRSGHNAKRSRLFFTSMTALISGLLGLTAGWLLFANHPDSCLKTVILHEPGVDIREIYTSIDTTFTYNRTFGADPQVNTGTLEAWNSIVPRAPTTSPPVFRKTTIVTDKINGSVGQGTVQYPPHSGQFFTLSVVHQLHCLWALHQSHYAALHRGNGGEDNTSAHVRHCFDYLRQTLTCAADMTLEPIDRALGGVTGWGNPRICRDYSVVKAWAREHRANNLRGFSH